MKPTGKSGAEHLAENVLALTEKFLAPWREQFAALVSTVAKEFGFQPEDLKRCNRAVLPARRAAVVLAVEFLNPPLYRDVIADWFGIGERTLYHFQSKVRIQEQQDAAYAARLAKLRASLRAAQRDKTR